MSLNIKPTTRSAAADALRLAIAVTEVDLVKATILWDKEIMGPLERQIGEYQDALMELDT